MNIVRVIAAATAIALLGLACGDSAPADKESNALKSRDGNVLRWGVISTMPPRTLKVGGGIDYCVGDPRPTIRRPQIRYQGGGVYIRLEAKMPHERPSKNSLCGSKELLITKTIVLRRDLSDVRIYDSGVKPPGLRWPLG